MRQKLALLATALGLCCFIFNCAKAPDYPITPKIEFKSMSKNSLVQSTNAQADSILLTFKFQDGDGDLGSKDSANIYIFDGRDSFAKPPYRIPFIDQQGAGNGIDGEITIRLNTVCCTFIGGYLPCSKVAGQPTNTLTYLVYIKDRAGHQSNTIETPSILLHCD